MTKRLMCIFATLLLVCSPALAEYFGTLSNSQSTTFVLDNNSITVGGGAATICLLVPAKNHSDGSEPVCQELTVTAPNTSVQLQLASLSGATRVVVFLDPAPGGDLVLRVTQPNGTAVQDEVTADARLVFDVVP